MKNPIQNFKVLLVLASLSSGAFALGQTWTEVKGVIPHTDTASWVSSYMGQYGTGANDNEKLVSALRAAPKSGAWHSYLKTGGSGSPNPTLKDGTVDTSSLLSIGGYDGGGIWMQHYSVFNLSQEVREADGAKISFEMDFFGTNKTAEAYLDINVLPWNYKEVEVILGRAAPGQENSTIYMFGLLNLSTGEFVDCELSTGDLMFFDYAQNDWKWKADEDGGLVVSFNLDPSDLANSDDGFALVIESTWGGARSGAAEYYSVGNFKLETLSVPEPSTYAAVFGVLVLAFAIYRRRK